MPLEHKQHRRTDTLLSHDSEATQLMKPDVASSANPRRTRRTRNGSRSTARSRSRSRSHSRSLLASVDSDTEGAPRCRGRSRTRSNTSNRLSRHQSLKRTDDFSLSSQTVVDSSSSLAASTMRAKSKWRPSYIMSHYIRHQLDIPGVLIAIVLIGAYAFKLPFFKSFVESTCPRDPSNPDSPHIKCRSDAALVAFYFVTWTFLRALALKFFFAPLARALSCASSRRARFGEQGWLFVYYTCSFALGLYFYKNSPYWQGYDEVWRDYPHTEHRPFFKVYYLGQLAFWLHQLVVIHIEKPRSDYYQLLAHHICTSLVVLCSYVANFTRVGNVVFVLMDAADILLALVKCLLYCKFKTVADVAFVIFTTAWITTRHVMFVRVIWSAVFRSHIVAPRSVWEPATENFAGPYVQVFFSTLLIMLQLLMCYWLFLILRIAYRAITSTELADDRSDDEDDGESNENDVVVATVVEKKRD